MKSLQRKDLAWRFVVVLQVVDSFFGTGDLQLMSPLVALAHRPAAAYQGLPKTVIQVDEQALHSVCRTAHRCRSGAVSLRARQSSFHWSLSYSIFVLHIIASHSSSAFLLT